MGQVGSAITTLENYLARPGDDPEHAGIEDLLRKLRAQSN
jgi:hypothetical protein